MGMNWKSRTIIDAFRVQSYSTQLAIATIHIFIHNIWICMDFPFGKVWINNSNWMPRKFSNKIKLLSSKLHSYRFSLVKSMVACVHFHHWLNELHSLPTNKQTIEHTPFMNHHYVATASSFISMRSISSFFSSCSNKHSNAVRFMIIILTAKSIKPTREQRLLNHENKNVFNE